MRRSRSRTSALIRSTSASRALLPLAERPALGHELLGRGGVALGALLPDGLRQDLDARPQVVALGAQRALLHVELEDPVDVGRRVAATPGEPGADGVGFGAEAADVEHGPDGSGGPSLGWEGYPGRGGRTVADGVADVWFRVTDLEVASGSGCTVTTTDGIEYLDFSSGIAVTSTGHCHPHVVAAIQAQAAQFIHAQVNVYRHTRLGRARRPAGRHRARAGIDTFFFANSGAEATESAVKLAKQATGRPNVIVFQGSFHGRTHLAMAMTTSKTVYRAGHAPLPVGRVRGAVPDPGRRTRSTPASTPCRPAPAQPDRARGDGGHAHRAGARRGRLHPRPHRLPAGARGDLPGARDPVHRRRGPERLRAHRHDVLRRAARRSGPTSS